MNTSNSITHLEKNSIRTSIPTLRQIIADTAQQQNEWDDSPKVITLEAMKRTVATHNKRRWLVVASQDVSALSLSSPVVPSPHIFPIKNKMSIISCLVRQCHRCRRVIIVSPVDIIITIVVVSRCAAAHHVARYAITIIVDFIARRAVAESEPKLGVKKTLWWPIIELTQYVSTVLHCEIGIGNNIFQLLRDVSRLCCPLRCR